MIFSARHILQVLNDGILSVSVFVIDLMRWRATTNKCSSNHPVHLSCNRPVTRTAHVNEWVSAPINARSQNSWDRNKVLNASPVGNFVKIFPLRNRTPSLNGFFLHEQIISLGSVLSIGDF